MTTTYEPASNAHLFVVVRDSLGTDYGFHFEICDPRIVLEHPDQALSDIDLYGRVVNREVISLDALDKLLDK